MTELFDFQAQFFDASSFAHLSLRLLLDLVFTGIVVLCVYVRRHGRNEYLFSYVMFNVITFTLCFLLKQAPIELGFALGLFAVFGILRYRTEPIQIHELTYLFIVIGIGILNAVVDQGTTMAEVLFVNAVIVGVAALLEYVPWFSPSARTQIIYDDLECLRGGDKAALIADLAARTGLDIQRVAINDIDLLRETARITVHFRR